VGDLFGGGAERDAANAEVAGRREAIGEARRQFDLNRADLAPRIEAEQSALEQLLRFLGVRGADAEREAIEGFQESPGQAFLRKRQERALVRNASATGGLRGGNILTALQEQANDIASTQLGDRMSRLAGVASGNTAVAGANIGTNLTNSIMNQHTGIGTARATGIRGEADARRSTLARIAGAFT
jgi:hypothetical protein